MTYQEFQSAIQDDVNRILKENQENILNSLVQNLPQDEPCVTKEQLLMCQNAIHYSVHASVKTMVHYLNQLGMIDLDNIEMNPKHHLKILHGGLDKSKD